MYSFGLVATAVARSTSALRSAPRIVGGAGAALALVATGVGLLANQHATHVPSITAAQASVSRPSLSVIGSLSGEAFAATFRGNLDGAVNALLAITPSQVGAIWRDLPGSFRSTLVESEPEVIGNLAGVTYADRSAANESRLPELQRQAQTDLAQAVLRSRTAGADAQAELLAALAKERVEAVDILTERYESGRGRDRDVPQYLIELDTTVVGPPLAAVAVGDLDEAKFASFFVPGMNSSVLELPDYLRGVERMQEASDDSAAVLWLGYQSPGPVDTVSTDHAGAGSVRFASALAGYDAVRDTASSAAEVTVIGHSYGSTTAALALATDDYDVSSFVMIGSAGVPSELAITDLHVRQDRVYVSQASDDALADSGRFWSGRADPADPAWGAQRFGSDGRTLADGTILAAVRAHGAVGASHDTDHDKYLGAETESLYDIRKIITGQSREINPDPRTISRDATVLAEG
ncbi:alpha/beta hydrolase [Mycetocola zhadangensis]|uniref:DUF1023 domain-containing protein n=1 Tax=Mycetocola zhadangensis TaxID=1164595 RepID=A0A3L7ISV6_9MICO|nr:alpha/beta hydrolase [Mycetocola zhadangensis]RLQ81190.1 hypothetical protein D9V28_15770 [Mycetocola zhadangensis]GGF05534.1 hypothetical protein GCM10011313_30840 [Mycetocola zhadangensis]